MIEHYVLFRAKRGRAGDLEAALGIFEQDLQDEPWLIELTHGANINPRSVELGWTHGMLSRLPDYETFQNEYWNHAAHRRFMASLDDCCDTRFAIDYEVRQTEEISP